MKIHFTCTLVSETLYQTTQRGFWISFFPSMLDLFDSSLIFLSGGLNKPKITSNKTIVNQLKQVSKILRENKPHTGLDSSTIGQIVIISITISLSEFILANVFRKN